MTPRQRLATRLRKTANAMNRAAAEMYASSRYFQSEGFTQAESDLLDAHSREMFGAARMAESWAQALKEPGKDGQG